MVIVTARLHKRLLLRVLAIWHIGPRSHLQLVSVSSWLLSRIARQGILQGFVFMFMLSWDYYKCPPTLSLASMCLREGAFNHLLVLILWSELCFLSSKLGCLTPSGSSVGKENFTSDPHLCLLLLALAMLLSSLSVLNQAMKSVPDILDIGGYWSVLLNSCVGAMHGILGGVTLPKVSKKISGNRLSFLVTIGLFSSTILPAAVIFFLDSYCLGNWSALWHPCRTFPEQFNRVVLFEKSSVPLLRPADICDSHNARAKTSLSKCMQVLNINHGSLFVPRPVAANLR